VSIGYAHVEAYGYHAIETLQCFVERRRQGEVGVNAVTYLAGDDVWRAIDDGTIRGDLVDAAVDCIEEKPEGSLREHCQEPMAFVFEYNDGLRAATLMLNGYVHDFAFAGDVGGEVQACEVYLQRDFPHGHFNYLSLNIEEMFVTGRPSYPVERTLLSTGMTNAVMDSLNEHRRVETPWLAIAYEPAASIPWQTKHPRPTGASVAIWPPR
ncbi:MAG: hypothetical protein HYU66_01295, partial [Armatimonadetes bacterium]|nr:hypothetical protein [Armatimonadota bacterium]